MQGTGRKQFTQDEVKMKNPSPLTAAAALLSKK
jgi:hypothetical protein